MRQKLQAGGRNRQAAPVTTSSLRPPSQSQEILGLHLVATQSSLRELTKPYTKGGLLSCRWRARNFNKEYPRPPDHRHRFGPCLIYRVEAY